MIPLTLAQVADIVGGELDHPWQSDGVVNSVTIDSRQVHEGALFVALDGERVDGHDYVDRAATAGARGYLRRADRDVDVPGGIAVDDPADALLALGLWIRDIVDPTVVMVTGSNGKTTTKDLIAAAIGPSRATIATTGSQNNELGLPLTCCRLEADSDVLIAEIGMRGEGQIAALAMPMRPDIAVVTNVAGVHLELLGSLDAIARAKSELVQALVPGGAAVLNADDPLVAAMSELPGGFTSWYYGQGRSGGGAPDDGTSTTVRATNIRLDSSARPQFALLDDGGTHDVTLGVPGEHNVNNALAAYCVAKILGIAPTRAIAGLESAQLSPWRMQLDVAASGLRVLNDAYNANPDSTAAALSTLRAIGDSQVLHRIAVLGHMAEIGPTSHAEHVRIGRLAADMSLDGLVVVGHLAAGLSEGATAGGFAGALGLHHVADPDEAIRALENLVGPADIVLVKASRSAGLERVALHLAGAES